MKIVHMAGKSVVKIVEAPEPVPGPGEVVIETAMSGICGSEMHTYREEGMRSGNGGHEAVGTVVKLGECVPNLKVGQRVGTNAIAECGACPTCVKGQYTWCPNNRFYGNMHADRFLAAANRPDRHFIRVGWP